MLTTEEVQHIAQLARVAVKPEEVETLRVQLSQILDHFETLKELDTAAIPPTGHAVDMQNVMREDEPAPSYPVTEVLANAPAREDDFIRVLRVLEG